MYFVLLYSAANLPLKRTSRVMGQVSFHKEFWGCYWRCALQLIGSMSQSQKKIPPVWSKNKGGGGDRAPPL